MRLFREMRYLCIKRLKPKNYVTTTCVARNLLSAPGCRRSGLWLGAYSLFTYAMWLGAWRHWSSCNT